MARFAPRKSSTVSPSSDSHEFLPACDNRFPLPLQYVQINLSYFNNGQCKRERGFCPFIPVVEWLLHPFMKTTDRPPHHSSKSTQTPYILHQIQVNRFTIYIARNLARSTPYAILGSHTLVQPCTGSLPVHLQTAADR